MVIMKNIFKNKKVIITGHTGFKGSWLSEWMLQLEAKVYGYALAPNTNPSIFEQLELSKRITKHEIGDIRNQKSIGSFIREIQPDFLFHLAAQPLVRYSYEQPAETFETNVLGTTYVLDSLKKINIFCTAIIITTDKCYENKEWYFGYRETDPLGGHDPYSASKACAEIVTLSYIKSFFNPKFPDNKIGVASARAGNVIGGGDWAIDRIVPDTFRALFKNQKIIIRNPFSVRPWQHVLEPLYGYLLLASKIHNAQKNDETNILNELCSPFNFGPNITSNQNVKGMVEEILKYISGEWTTNQDSYSSQHEAKILNLNTDKAYKLLKWSPKLNFKETIKNMVFEYTEISKNPESARDIISKQIQKYSNMILND